MGIINQIAGLSEENVNKLGKSSTRLQEAGVHQLKIKEAYETEGAYPQLVLTFVSNTGLELNYRGFLQSTDYNTKEVGDNMKVLGYFFNIHKAIFGKDFDKKDLGKNVSAGTTTNKKGVTSNTTIYGQLIGKIIGQGTYSEITAGDKANKKDVQHYVNQVIDEKAIFTKDFVSMTELAAGVTEGKAYEAIADTLKTTFKIGSGFKDHKICKQVLKEKESGGKVQVVEDAPVEDVDSEENPF